MRALALLGGMAIVGAIALAHHVPADRAAAGARRAIGCGPSGAELFCKAVTGLDQSLRSPPVALADPSRRPPRETPGTVDTMITQANIEATICRPGYAQSVRPAYGRTDPFKRRLMVAQHPGEAMADYELDHLIPISLGGAPFDRRDLWLQPRRGQANSGDKNVLAYVLWRLVCRREVTLAVAQRAIRQDWIQAYEVYATPANIERFHFRHAERDGG